jgi:hypothetical protein
MEALLPLSIGVHIWDLLDWHHPYFHDYRPVRWFKWEIQNGESVLVLAGQKMRRGAVHKTKLFDRCEFSAKRTSDAHRLEYLDALPPSDAPESPDGAYSNRLCAYCFDIIPKQRRRRGQFGPLPKDMLSQRKKEIAPKGGATSLRSKPRFAL